VARTQRTRLGMLKFLKRWLGWDSDTTLFDFSSLTSRSEPRPGTPPPAVRTPPVSSPTRPAAQTNQPAQTTPAAKPKRKDRTPAELLDNPRLTLDKPQDDGFDPYNTGAFNRSTSWEKIGRQRKR
jgi:hypothetical protein